MKTFMDKDFLLDTDTARRLYHEDAAGLPIFDYHCHLSPREIAEDKPFTDLAEIWLKGDHYKWRIMRSNGADESLCSGSAPWPDKFTAFASALEQSPGNPLLHWSHLELQRTYGIHDALTAKNALSIRERPNALERARRFPSRHADAIRRRGYVHDDDPADDPPARCIAPDPEVGAARGVSGKKVATILPAFLPHKAMNAQDAAAWKSYAATLGAAVPGNPRLRRPGRGSFAPKAFYPPVGAAFRPALLVPPIAPRPRGNSTRSSPTSWRERKSTRRPAKNSGRLYFFMSRA